ncbi:MAG: trypsin-like peptidase domain-containing protein [Planctomycetes bacterium]|nr:trypsin-like peptidase domain-containing protein [Planctomycetota bacterium]
MNTLRKLVHGARSGRSASAERARRAGRAATSLLFVAVLSLALVWHFSGRGDAACALSSAEPRAVAERTELEPDERRTVELFRSVSPATVNVTNIGLYRTSYWDMDVTEVPQGTGSGFVWDDDGHVVTNFHVVANGSRFKVTFANGDTFDAAAVGVDPDSDIAVLKVDAPSDKLVPLQIGRSSDLQVGQKVYAIGHPFGLDQTLTTGIISGLNREIRSKSDRRIRNVVQTDAAINPGNSGGPLMDSAGRLIGMNTAILSPSGTSSGVGFAVPVDTINRIVPKLISGTDVERPGLGVTINERASRFLRAGGLIVAGVESGGAAARAGIQPPRMRDNGDEVYDVIVGVGNRQVRSMEELRDALDGYDIGDEVPVSVRRDGKVETMRVKLQGVAAQRR